MDMKDETEEEFTEFVKSKRLIRQDSDFTKNCADNNAKTAAVSTTKAEVDSYPKANKEGEVETIDTDKDEEKKTNETGKVSDSMAKVDPYPRANEAEELEPMVTNNQNLVGPNEEDANFGPRGNTH